MKKIVTSSIILSLIFVYSCTKEVKLSKEEDEYYSKIAVRIVKESNETLFAHLVSKLEREGVGNAIKYCNHKALPLIDSLSKEFDAEIRRTSLRIRNPKNKPRDYEKDELNEYFEQWKKQEQLMPKLKKYFDGSIVFYVPIILVNPICLNCHGVKGLTVVEPNTSIIDSLYPTDEAIGFKTGDFRGMWTVRFKPKSKSK